MPGPAIITPKAFLPEEEMLTDQDKTGKAPGPAWPLMPPEIAETLQMQFQALLEEQAEFLAETQRSMAAWTKRRQEAMQANFRTFTAMGTSLDPASLNAAYNEWLTSSMGRIFEDMDDVRKEALRAAGAGQRSVAAVLRLRENAKGPPQPASRDEVKLVSQRKAAE
jgi:hypothetical protein